MAKSMTPEPTSEDRRYASTRDTLRSEPSRGFDGERGLPGLDDEEDDDGRYGWAIGD